MHIVVIGAGVQGITTAYYLNKFGAEVTVVDAASGPAMECSYGNGGGITPSAVDPWNAPGIAKVMFKYLGRKDSPLLFRLKAIPDLTVWGLQFLKYANMDDYLNANKQTGKLANYSVELLEQIRQDTNIDYRHSSNGTLKIFRDQRSLDDHLHLSEIFKTMGNADFKMLDAQATIDVEPSLNSIKDNLSGSLFFSGDEAGNSHIFCQQMTSVLEQRGVKFLFNSPVSNITKQASLFNVEINETSPNIQADKVVVATGAKAPSLLAHFGIKVPVKPAKGYSLSIPMNGWDNRPKHLIADMNLHAGINPLGNTLRVAGTAEFAGFDPEISSQRIDNLIGLVESVFPDFAQNMNRDQLNPWAGFRPMSCDGMAILGKTKVDGLYLNTGQGAQGWTTSAACGRLLADTIFNKSPRFDISPFSISRF